MLSQAPTPSSHRRTPATTCIFKVFASPVQLQYSNFPSTFPPRQLVLALRSGREHARDALAPDRLLPPQLLLGDPVPHREGRLPLRRSTRGTRSPCGTLASGGSRGWSRLGRRLLLVSICEASLKPFHRLFNLPILSTKLDLFTAIGPNNLL